MGRKKRAGLMILLALVMAFSVINVCSAEAVEYTVTLEYEDNIARPHNVYVTPGAAMDEPAQPLRKGYDFAGWSKTQDGEIIAFPYTPAGDETLHAVWEARKCSITFDFGLEGTEPLVIRAEYGVEVVAPEVAEQEGMSFLNWSLAPGEGEAVGFPVIASADMTYYAVWAEGDLNIIKFDLNYEGGGTFATLSLADGEKITKKMIDEPERDNYSFSGWSEKPDGKTVKLPYKPKGSMTLYAIWKRNEYKVAFRNEYTDNPSVVFLSMTVDGGESIDKPDAVPEREGYIFTGWYRATSGGEEITFPFTPTGNSAIYAHWEHEPVVTNVFQAEYVFIDPNETFPGYSGEARGTGIIASVTTETGTIVDEEVPITSKYTQRIGNYVTYLYKNGATLEFVINASEDTSAKLFANLAIEIQPNWVFAPTGENAYKVFVNGEEIDYGTINFVSSDQADTGYKSPFQQFNLGTVQLKAGENTIQLVTANNNKAFGGTIQAVAPMVDCIMLDGSSGELSWSPVYDNII